MTNGGRFQAKCAPVGEHWPDTGTGAVVIGAAYGALGIVRSLGQRGIPVWPIFDSWDGRVAVKAADFLGSKVGQAGNVVPRIQIDFA